MNAPLPPLEVVPRDLSAYRAGNTGIDYVHRFESGRPGPHVMVNALTHGNEFCGMVAVCHLLDSRLITHNLNRIWSSAWLDGGEDSVELRRAREMRPAVAAADHILDIHSTSQDVVPFWVYPAFERNAAVARSLPQPAVHLVMPAGLGSGTPLIQHGAHGSAEGAGAALVVECGQHFKQASSDVAIEVATNFLAYFGLIDRPVPRAAMPPRRFELLRTHVIQNDSFAFARPVIGFETFAAGELIAIDGALEIRAPCDDCTIFMPARQAIVGREGVYLTRPMQ